MNGAGEVEIERTIVNGRPVLRLRGHVDLHSSPQLRSMLLEAAANMPRQLLVDLSGVEYMDSSGVGTMVYLKREVESHGQHLILLGLQPRVRSVLEITHLDRFFTIRDRLEDIDTP